MRKYLIVALFILGFFGCSRETSIVPNPLLGTHPVVLLLQTQPKDLQAFVDSIADLPGDSVNIADTITVTKNDTVWCVGYFKGNTNSVRVYNWKISDGRKFDKRTYLDLLPIAFADTGVYQAKYELIDGVRGKDSAGYKQYIRVIDIAPSIVLESDTVKASAKGPALLTLTVKDSVGRIDSLKLDVNADGKWDSTFYDFLDNEEVTLKVPKIAGKVDSLGNQKIFLGAWDDDGNVIIDTLYVHFNVPPVLTLEYPQDSSRVSYFERFAFYWKGKDIDNEKDLKYTLRVGKVPVLTQTHTKLSLSTQETWEQVKADSTLTDSTLTGHLYWQVWVTDGFDTVFSPVRKFYLGDPSVRFATVKGVAKMQANARHDGIRITLMNRKTGAQQLTKTNPSLYIKGDYSFTQVEPGCYRVTAQDTVDLYYSPASIDSFCVDIGETLTLDTLLLKDDSKPRVALLIAADTLYTTRSVQFKGIFADSGSRIAMSTIKATIDGATISLTNSTKNDWTADLSNLPDGRHIFALAVSDSAGNKATTLQIPFKVRATKVNLQVAGPSRAFGSAISVLGGTGIAGSGDSLHFKVEVENISPSIDTVYFAILGTSASQKSYSGTAVPVVAGKQTFVLDTLIDASFDSVRSAVVYVRNDSGLQYLDTVTYRVRDRAKASVLFTNPAKDITVTLHDILNLTIDAQSSEAGNIIEYAWDIDHNKTTNMGSGFEGTGATWPTLTFNAPSFGVWSLKVRIEDDKSGFVYDTVNVTVLSQPPTVQVANKLDTVKINGDIQLNAFYSDIAPGTIEKLEWKCGNDPYEEVLPGLHTVIAPSTAQTLKCLVRVTDNDGETAMDSLTVYVRQDKPTLRTLQDSGTVTIKDTLYLKAIATDTLGTLVSKQWSCGAPGVAGVTGWKSVNSLDTFWMAPSTATNSYLCVVRVTDDDAQTAQDTIKWKILLDPPRVRVTEDSLFATINDQLQLDAIAFDSLGKIVSYEWSCGAPGAGGVTGWVAYGSPSVGVTVPGAGMDDYLCVIRVADDDGNGARDTVHITVDQDAPTVQINKKYISTRVNEFFPISSTASDKFGTISSYRWSCGEPGVAGVSNWSAAFQENSTILQAPATATVTWLCVVEVRDSDNQAARDTAHILVLDPPQAVVRADVKLPVWSGDVDVPSEYRYWNTAIDGISSVIGQPWGNALKREYWWNFSHYNPTAWWLGPEDGSLDVSYYGFDEALVRPTSPMTIKVRLDFRDSILPAGETDSAFIYDFYLRHLDYDSGSVQFVRYWKTFGPDTVIEPASRAMGLVASPTGPIAAYRNSSTGFGMVKQWNGTAWNTIGGGDVGEGSQVDSLRIARDPVNGDVYVGYYINPSLFVKKSPAGTGAWETITGALTVNGGVLRAFSLSASNQKVAAAWIGNDSLGAVAISTAGSAWGWNGTAGTYGTATGTTKSKELTIAFNGSTGDSLAIAYVSTGYKLRLRFARSTNLGTLTTGVDAYSGLSDAHSMAWSSNGTIYMGFNNRTSIGPKVRSWNSGTFADVGGSTNIGTHLVGKSTSMAIGSNGLPIFAYEDNFFDPYISVWQLEGSTWKLKGENFLPHFKGVFNAAKGYYLRGSRPSLAVAPNGTVYVATMALDGRGASGPNNGVIVLRYEE